MFRFWFLSVFFLWIHETQLGHCEEFCGEPPALEKVIISPSGLKEYRIGTELKYSCDFGYLSHQASPTRKCVPGEDPNSAVWTNIDINCIPRSCGDPGNINHGRLNGSVFSFPHSVTYICDEGYKLQGSSLSRFCQPNGDWSGNPPSCVKITCAFPANPQNGRAIYRSLEYNGELWYECSKGFRPDDLNVRVCGSDGQWSGSMPSCTEVKCNFPASPEHGSVDLPGGIPKVDGIAFYKCDEGRKLVGALRTKCLASGDWTFPPPACVEPCTVPAIPNGYLIKKTGRWSKAEEVFEGTDIEDENRLYLRCNNNFSPNGQPVQEVHVSCSDGKWAVEPKCFPGSCTTQPPLISHGTLRTTGRSHGTVLWYKCHRNYYKFKSGNVTCLEGNWHGVPPICKDTRCYINYSNVPGIVKWQHGEYADGRILVPQCKEGYKLSDEGATEMTCSNGEWTGSIFPCIGAKCTGPPPSLVNGNIEIVEGRHGTAVKYVCHEHFILKESSEPVMCDLGVWKGKTPECKDSRCHLEDLIYKNGVDFTDSTPVFSGDIAEVKCLKGYTLENDKPTCSAGKWEESRVSPCVEKKCVVTYLRNGHFELKVVTEYYSWGRKHFQVTYSRAYLNSELPQGSILYVSCRSPTIFNGRDYAEHVAVECDRGEWSPQPHCLMRGQRPPVPHPEPTADKSVATTRRPPQLPTTDAADLINPERTFQPVTTKKPDVTSSTKLPGFEKPVDCSCTYNNMDSNLFAYAGQKKLQFGEKVKNNSKVHFICRIFGFHRLRGPAELTCRDCSWHSSEFPSCVSPAAGEPVIGVNSKHPDAFAYLSPGIVYVRPYVDINVTCHLHNDNQPIDFSGPRKEVRPILDYISVGNTHVWTGILSLKDTRSSDSGVYRCSKQPGGTSHEVHMKIEEVGCPAINADDDLLVRHIQEDLDEVAVFSCVDESKELNGPDKLKCMVNREWSGNIPKCDKVVSCPELVETEGLTITYPDGRKANGSAAFHCAEPYRRKGSPYVTCLADGEWSETSPFCTLPTCLVDSLLNALPETATVNQENVNTETLPYGTSLKIICQDDNYQIIGNRTATCKESGKWAFGEIKCVYGCGITKPSEESTLIIDPIKDVYRFGDSVVFTCNPGQKLTPNVQRVICLQNGWSEKFPDCIDITQDVKSPKSERRTP